MAATDLDGVHRAELQEQGDGWMAFAGTILGLSGMMRILDAFWTFDYQGELPAGLQAGVVGSELRTYGWVWLLVGIALVISSVLVLSRVQLARWFGVAAASLSLLGATLWLPFYPIWSLTYILLSVLVIYALAVHGGRRPAL